MTVSEFQDELLTTFEQMLPDDMQSIVILVDSDSNVMMSGTICEKDMLSLLEQAVKQVKDKMSHESTKGIM